MGVLESIGSIIGGTASAIGSAAGGLASGAGSLAGSGISTLGSIGGGVVDVAAGTIEALPTIAENIKPIVEVAGGVYGAYTSYEQAKAAREAAQKYGQQVNLPLGGTPIVIESPAPASAIPTLSYGSPPMTEEESLFREAQQQTQADQGKFLMVAALIIGGYFVLKKVK